MIEEILDQVNIYKQYYNKVRYIFKGNVPDAVRKALEAAGVVVEVVP